MPWTRTLETGHERIDDRHRELFGQIDHLMSENLDDDPNDVLSRMEAFTVQSFAEEQKMHAKANYPSAEQHKRQHEGLLAAFRRIRGQYAKNGPTLASVMAFNRSILEGLRQHIQNEDQAFVDFCNFQEAQE